MANNRLHTHSKNQRKRRLGLNLIAKAIRKMKRSTHFIIAITAMAFVGSAVLLISSDFSKLASLLVASAGGLVVFCGLWIEKDADNDREKHPSRLASAKGLIKISSQPGVADACSLSFVGSVLTPDYYLAAASGRF